MRRIIPLALALLSFGAREPAAAQGGSLRADSAALSRSIVFRLRNGPNPLDLAGNRLEGMVLVARRENFNAHGYSALTFLIRDRIGDDATPVWQAVTFDRQSNETTRTTHEGADCILTDYRVIRRAPGRPVTVIVAAREVGASYADQNAVTFQLFELKRNTEQVMGWPPYSFQLARTLHPARRYCDVNAAFDRELGLGTAGVGGVGAPDGG